METTKPAAALKPALTFTQHEQHVHTYRCEQCARPIHYVIHQYRLGNGKFMPAHPTHPPQCSICGSIPKDFQAPPDGYEPNTNSAFNMNADTSFSSSDAPRSAEILVERAEAVGPDGNHTLDTASYTTCLTHLDASNMTIRDPSKELPENTMK